MLSVLTTSRGRVDHLRGLLGSFECLGEPGKVRLFCTCDGPDAELARKVPGVHVVRPPSREFAKLQWLQAAALVAPSGTVVHLDADTWCRVEMRAELERVEPGEFGIAALVDGRDQPDEQGFLVSSRERLLAALGLAPLGEWRGYGPEDIHLRCRLAMLGEKPRRVPVTWGRHHHSDELRTREFAGEPIRASFARLYALHEKQLQALEAQGFELAQAMRAELEYHR